MGEMADYYLDSENPDSGLYEPGGTRACRCCGEANLHWKMSNNGKWVLCNNKGIHNCPVSPLPT